MPEIWREVDSSHLKVMLPEIFGPQYIPVFLAKPVNISRNTVFLRVV